jgi:hypothetical protein
VKKRARVTDAVILAHRPCPAGQQQAI